MTPDRPSSVLEQRETTAPSATRQAASRGADGLRSGERLRSLDALRGFVMFWIVGGGAVMAGLHQAAPNRITDFLVYELQHSPWQGLRFYDCIWPCFMVMVGVAVPFSFAKRSANQSYIQITAHALQRSMVLFLLGALRESRIMGSPYLVELSSALQPIAISYFIAVLLVRQSLRVQVLVGAAILAGYALLLALVPSSGVPAGSYEFNHNLVHSVDMALLRAHWERWPYAAEGWGTVLSTIPTIATTILGLVIGQSLMNAKSKTGALKTLGMAALICLATGYALSPFVPVVMKMWTTSYGLLSAGYACLLFMIFYWIIDVRRYERWSFPFVVIGTNALFIYMFRNLAPIDRTVSIFTKGIAAQLGSFGPLFSSLWVVLVEWLLLLWMYRRRIFLKA